MSQNVILFDAVTARYAKPPDPDEVDKLYDTLAYKIEGADHAPQAKKFIFDPRQKKMVYNKRYTGWDGIKRLYDRRTHSFPIGIIHRALAITPNVLVKPLAKAIDRQSLDTFQPELLYTPMRHQIEAFNRLTQRGHAMVELPTASGKSLVIAMLARALNHGIGLITVPSKYLLHQTKADIEELTQGKLQLGIYGDGECDLKQITIATMQSLYSGIQSRGEILAWMAEVDWWVADETHGAAAESWQDVSLNLPKAMVRYGLTATCRREDNAELLIEGAIGPLVYRETALKLIEEGVLVTPEVEIHWFDPGQLNVGPGAKYNTVYKAAVSENEARNDRILGQCWRAVNDGMCPALVIVDEKAHGKTLAKLLKDNGFATENIDGDDPMPRRLVAVDKLLNGTYSVLVASGIFNTGINIPPIRTVINAAAGKSVTETIQRGGRVLRRSPKTGKTVGRLIDFYDDEPRYLRRHAKMRRMTYMEVYGGYVKEFTPDGDEDGL